MWPLAKGTLTPKLKTLTANSESVLGLKAGLRPLTPTKPRPFLVVLATAVASQDGVVAAGDSV